MVKSITLRPRKSCDFLGQPLPTISRSPTAGLLGIGQDVLSQQQKDTTRYSRYHVFVSSCEKQPCALGQPCDTLVSPLRPFSFRLQTACHAFQQSSQLFSTYFPAIFHHAYAAYAMCTVDVVVPSGPVRLDRGPHRRRRCCLEVHLRARLSSSSDSRRHEMP